MWVHLPVGVATGAVSAEFSLPKLVQDGLGHDGSRRVAGAQEQNVERTVHGTSLLAVGGHLALQTAGKG